MPHTEPSAAHGTPPIGTVLAQLRALLQEQADAINADNFDQLAQLTASREPIMVQLSQYTAADLAAPDRALAEQVTALDQQVMELARESLIRTGQEIRDLDRGRAALNQYGQRGRQLIQNLAHLSEQD